MLQLKQMALSLIVALAAWQLGSGGFIYFKAQVAQILMAQAWDKTLAGEQQVKPWAWADTYPVAKLIWPQHDVDMTILQGSSGRTLAFGPGHMSNTPKPGESGNSVVGGHRDTHFGFLAGVQNGEVFTIQTSNNQLQQYQVYRQFVVDQYDVEPVLALDAEFDQITFVTCYPFNAITTGGPLRYVVMAKRVIEDEAVLVAALE